MEPHEKFALPGPSADLLEELGQLVDEIETRSHQSLPYQDLLDRLNERLTTPTDVQQICTYYGVSSRDEFLRQHLTPTPYEFADLSDTELLWLIAEIIQDPFDDLRVGFYSAIVAANVRCRAEQILECIEDREMTGSAAVLEQLRRRDHVIRL